MLTLVTVSLSPSDVLFGQECSRSLVFYPCSPSPRFTHMFYVAANLLMTISRWLLTTSMRGKLFTWCSHCAGDAEPDFGGWKMLLYVYW